MNNDFWHGVSATTFVVMAICLLVLIGTAFSDDLPNIEIPVCPEDTVLIGTGSYKQGRWEDYYCGPSIDDYQGY